MEIWGHRGAYHLAPENTLPSFQMAIRLGADGVEFDIQLTRDGEVVVIHDETVDRTSDGLGYVKDFSLSEIKKLNFNKRDKISPFFMEIPTLAEVFELLGPTKLKINVELKTGLVFYEDIEEKALALAKKYGILDRIVWSSFNHYSVSEIKRLEPGVETALLCGGGILLTAEQCEKTGASALHPDIRQLRFPGLARDCHKRGIKVRAYTVNERDEFKLARDAGVDGIFTNRLDSAKEFFNG